jgi:UDP-N-acetyl-D-galactosamine dehydrogenase
VDPYYLTHKASEIGYHPEMILAGRRINDGMGAHIAQELMRLMSERRIMVGDAKVLVLGLAFKENCPDLRNSKVIDIVNELVRFDAKVDVYDPWVDAAGALREYRIPLLKTPKPGIYDAIVLAVGHEQFKALGVRNIRRWAKKVHVLYDVKYLFPAEQTDGRL